jgi:citrate lyase synthetase
MLLRELFEAQQKTAVFAFGRMNPPTVGHQKLVEKIKSIKGDHFVFLSQTQKPKTDPLDFATKLKLAQAFFPNVTVGNNDVRTIIQAMQKLERMGYKHIIYVAGSDRVESFTELLQKYNGKEYNFESIKVANAGARDPDKDGAEGMSASKMREAAATGNFEAFVQGVPDKKLARTMYDAVRAGMGVSELAPQENSNRILAREATDLKAQLAAASKSKLMTHEISALLINAKEKIGRLETICGRKAKQ